MLIRSANSSRGLTLGTILLLAFVVLTLVFALASSSVTHLHLSQRASNGEVAKNMAESAIAVALEKVLQDQEFGELRTEGQTIVLEGERPGSTGKLTFHYPTADLWGLQHSTNNFDNEGAQSGAEGRVVPGNALHLVGLGECHGVERRVEAVFHLPKFPFVVATTGKFQTEGEMLIASLERVDDFFNPGDVDPESIQPGHVVSNSLAGDALTIGPQTKVTGDAKAAGGVQIESGAEILGQIRPNASPADIPRYSVSDFDPDVTGKTGVHHLNQSIVNNVTYEGWVRRQGDLMVSNGLHLDSGVLYVDGDLAITGGVTGKGAVLVTGDTFIAGRSKLDTDNVAAIVSGGDVALQGSGKESSVFRGLVYSNKSLVAENMTLIGTLLVTGEEGNLNLRDSNVIYSPDSVRVDLKHSARTALTFVSPNGSNPGAFLGSKSSDKSRDSKTQIYVSLTSTGRFLIYPQGAGEEQGVEARDVSAAMAIIRGLVADGSEDELRAFDNTTDPKLTVLLTDILQGSVAMEEEAVDLLTLEPSSLLGLSDRVRLLLMKEL